MRRLTNIAPAGLTLAIVVVLGCGSDSAAPLREVTTDVEPTVFVTAEDIGPQDGAFDAFRTDPNLGAVNNNGFGSYRTAFEFPLPFQPSDAQIVSFTLRLPLLIFEGTRSVQIHGYAADGAQNLTDFARDQVLATFTVAGHQNFVIDVKAFVEARRAAGDAFVGFNVREAPANTENYTIMRVRTDPPPILRVEYTTRQ
jgi:hypothetical protein